MKKFIAIALATTVLFVFASAAFAVDPGKTVEFSGGAAGKVVFDGGAHAKAGSKCADAIQPFSQ